MIGNTSGEILNLLEKNKKWWYSRKGKGYSAGDYDMEWVAFALYKISGTEDYAYLDKRQWKS